MELIDNAFAKDNSLRQRIRDALYADAQQTTLFQDIAQYILTTTTQDSKNGSGLGNEEPATKKRKLVNGSGPRDQQRKTIFEIKDLSFSIPQRKKFNLSIVQYGNILKDASTAVTICVNNSSTNEVEVEVPVSSLAYALKLPVPEKAQKQFNFCLMPRSTSELPNPESLLWTVNNGPLKTFTLSSLDLEHAISGSDDMLGNALDFVLTRSGINLIQPTENEFASATPEPHRKGEKAYHVKAFKGSKDGYLFFLENGIFFGYKKPLSFFAFDSIESISYTSVLQRTFNLNIHYKESQAIETQEIEFSMIDQSDFPGIDAYIKKHQLQDASMAEARRAKLNKAASKQAQAANGQVLDERTEIQKAEEEMVDEEDELEEDYDPGSDGESDGSGGSSAGDDDEYDYEAEDNLVEAELGSEAEDVDSDRESTKSGHQAGEPNPDDESQL